MKTKRFLLAVAFATMTFTLFSCSSDDPEGGNNSPSSSSVGDNGNLSSSSSGGNDQYGAGACYRASIPMLPDVQACMRSSFGLTEVSCEHRSEREPGWTYRESCESNPALTCEIVNAEGPRAVVYFYGTLPAEFTCEVLDN